jgi:hypothetical protein
MAHLAGRFFRQFRLTAGSESQCCSGWVSRKGSHWWMCNLLEDFLCGFLRIIF